MDRSTRDDCRAWTRRLTGSVLVGLLTLGGTPGCKRSGDDTSNRAPSNVTPPGPAVAAGAPVAAVSEVNVGAVLTPSSAGATAPTPGGAVAVNAPGPVPTSFAGAAKVSVENAMGIGCEAHVVGGWLQLFCYKRNSTGGKPVRAVFDTPELAASARGEGGAQTAAAPVPAGEHSVDTEAAQAAGTGAPPSEEEIAARSVLPKETGELVLLLPWVAGGHARARMEWNDVAYDLIVEGTTGKLVRSENLPLRRACAQLARELEALRASAKRSEHGLAPRDTLKLHGFGHCQLSGSGAWALRLQSLTATGEGADRQLTASVELLHLNEAAAIVSAPYGVVQFAPEGLEMPLPMMFDYDGDGSHEAIVRYEVNKRAGASAAAQRDPAPSVFTLRDGKIVVYERGPTLTAGSASTEQLDNDLRPDVADYGPFIGWLGKGCGVANCPDRVTGPRFFWHSLPDGSFDAHDAAATAALTRACQKKPANVVAVVGAAANLKTTALHVACARVWQVEPKTIEAELTAQREKLCGAAASCAALTLLTEWANATPPATLRE